MSRISGNWLTAAATQRVFSLLSDAGHDAFAVGGCVRNALLGVPVADVDFATDARPEQVLNLAFAAGLKAVATGIDHGTVTLVIDGTGFEVTTFRKDVETDGRRAMVAYADRLEDDAHRRDFTINAIYARADGSLVDPLNGLADIATRQIRFIDDATARIGEDYLRILRFFRFHAWFGDPDGGLDPDALAACAQQADGLDRLSKERIGAEMRKLLAAADPAPALAAMAMTGILARLLPGASASPLAVLVHLEQAAGLAPDWPRRLAALGGEAVADNLRLSRSQARAVDLLRRALADNSDIADFAYRHGEIPARDLALVRAALVGAEIPEGLFANIARASRQVFPVRPADLMPGLSGPALGARLAELEDRWIASGFTLDRAALLGS